MARTTCAACHREIDATARLCAYCGADPLSGVKTYLIGLGVDAGTPIAAPAPRRAGRFARRRQSLLIASAIAGALIALLGLYEILQHRNKAAVTGATAATLTEIVDVKTPPTDTKPLPLPPMAFQFEGKPEAMRTLILEPGAVKPPEVLAAEREAQVKKLPRGPRATPPAPAPTP
ncbi:MAG TPA: zinc ribbon domain-containing protein [Thermoanaerobaculia bacterium]|nr:zinc ribbon domain-containing protein [Thermoanaerobaculia bacterium]